MKTLGRNAPGPRNRLERGKASMKKNVVRTLVLGILLLVFAIYFVSPSEAGSKPFFLKGTYGVSGLDVCVGHWVLNPAGDGSSYWTKTMTIQGTSTFHSDGTGTADTEQLAIIHPIYTPVPLGPYYNRPSWPVDPSTLSLGNTSTNNASSTFTYTIDPVTREITQVISSSGQVTSGSLSGKYFTSDTYTSTGHVSIDKKTIIGSTIPLSATPDQSDFTRTISFWNDAGHTDLYGSQEEICQRHRLSIQIGK